MPRWAKPPKKVLETIKPQGGTKAQKKMLDKPTQLVYNIRKDMAGVQHLYDTYVLDLTKINRNRAFGGHVMGNNVYYPYCARVRTICETAGVPYPILSGGALRDLVYNQHPKDFDFFFNCTSEDEAYEVIDRLTRALTPDEYTEGGPRDEYEEKGADFEGVYGVFNLRGSDIQFIVGVWPKTDNFFDRFDLSVCQAEMDIETYDVTFSEAFMETLATQEITMFKDTEYSRARCDRIAYNLSLKQRKKETDYCSHVLSALQAMPTTSSQTAGAIASLADVMFPHNQQELVNWYRQARIETLPQNP